MHFWKALAGRQLGRHELPAGGSCRRACDGTQSLGVQTGPPRLRPGHRAKEINDAFGHAAGDDALGAFAEVLGSHPGRSARWTIQRGDSHLMRVKRATGETASSTGLGLEPEQAPAAELGVLYHERWELESTLDELKVHQRGPRVVLRSKAPDGVYQEAYGYLCTHYAIRRLMHDAALQARVDPDRLSFTRSLRAARRSARTQPGFSPPDDRHGT